MQPQDNCGTNDLLGNMLSTGLSSTDFMLETNVVLPHLGIKLGDNYLFAGTGLDVTLNAAVDNDLIHFVKYGMADASAPLTLTTTVTFPS